MIQHDGRYPLESVVGDQHIADLIDLLEGSSSFMTDTWDTLEFAVMNSRLSSTRAPLRCVRRLSTHLWAECLCSGRAVAT